MIDAQATADVAARKAYNDAHRMILDDGAGVTYWNTAGTGQMDQPFPWFTPDNQVRVGAAVTFPKPVVMEWRNSTWKLQPQTRVTDDGSDRVAFEQNRPAEPEDVGGDLKLATFNVLNYFTTLGEDFAGCTAFNDRAGNPIAVNSCPGNGPRGAWNDVSFERQQTKIVNAINTIDADIVSVEEIENSLKVDNHDRDEALSALVDALNADAGAGTWDYVDSPASASDPSNIDEQDVIRTGFIYQPASVVTVGAADMLFDVPAFGNAREPFAQAFKAVGADDADGFAVIVNHFKSKGSGVDDGTGQGLANPDRIAQAEALSIFADDFAEARGVDAVFLAGDFNAASQEDPMQVLYGDGYVGLDVEDKWSYNFDGQAQSLDHVLANPAAEELVTGVDIWEINANESSYNQYSRYNYNATILYDEAPFSASDHNPEVIGIDGPDTEPVETSVTATGGPASYGTDWTAHVTVSPAAATGTVEVLDGTTSLGTATLTNGAADITISGTALQPGDHTLTVRYLGDAEHAPSEGSLQVEVAKAVSTTTLDIEPDEAVVGQDRITLTATVAATGVTPTGQVVFSANGVEIGSAPVTGGIATLKIGPAPIVGTVDVTAAYQGDATTAASTSDPEPLTVVKADVKLKADVKPDKVVVNKTKTRVEIEVSARGQKVTGKVEVKWSGESKTVTLKNGKATVQLGKWGSTGQKTVRVHYLGSSLANPATEVVKFQVRAK